MRWKESYHLSASPRDPETLDHGPGPPNNVNNKQVENIGTVGPEKGTNGHIPNGSANNSRPRNEEEIILSPSVQNGTNKMAESRERRRITPNTNGHLPEKDTRHGDARDGGLSLFSFVQDVGPPSQHIFFRSKWKKRAELVFTCMSLSIGVANLWRFPYIAHLTANPGAFVVAYLIVTVVLSLPINYMESGLGQFSGCGSGTVWRCLPFLKGLMISQILTTIVLTAYLNYIVSQYLAFIVIPFLQNDNNLTNSFESWSRRIFEDSEQHLISGCLGACWFLVLMSLLLSQRVREKIGYVTTALTYFAVLSLFAITLVCTYRNDEFSRKARNLVNSVPDGLKDVEIWYRATEQAFLSLHIGLGHVIVRSSQNSFKHKLHREVITIIVVDALISVLVGVIVLFGFSESETLNIKFNNTGMRTTLAFPHVFDTILTSTSNNKELGSIAAPTNKFLNALFFLIILMMGLGNVVSNVSSVIYTAREHLSKLSKQRIRIPFSIALCAAMFLLGTPLILQRSHLLFQSASTLGNNSNASYVTSQNGEMRTLYIMDSYAVGRTVYFYVLLEVIGVMWIYGARNFSKDMTFMIGQSVWKIPGMMWAFLTPIILLGVFVYREYEVIITHDDDKRTLAVGWTMTAFIVVVPIFVCAYVSYKRALEWGFTQKFLYLFKPESDWGPVDPLDRRKWLMKNSWRKRTPPSANTNSYHVNSAFQND